MDTTRQQATVIWPTLRYRDAPAAVRFLVEAFGFEVVVSHPGATADVIEHAELRWPGGGGVMLGTLRPDSSISELPAGTGSVYVVVDDPDPIYERARAAGARFARELGDEGYGSRGFTARDPEGVYWSFGTYGGA